MASVLKAADNDYEVAQWHGFSKCAVTYTFDDNTSKQLTVALPMFNKYNFKMTFYPVINWGPNWTELKKAYENGHEVGSHTVTHPYLNQLDSASEEQELQQSFNTINAQIGKGSCQTIAYPYCITGRIELLNKYFIGGRICSGEIVSANPKDFFNLSSILVGSQSSINSADKLNEKVNEAKSKNGWCVFLIHGIDNDGGYSSIQSTELDKNLSYLNENNTDFWVTTFVGAIKYIKERSCISIQETFINPDSIEVVVSDTLDNNVYNVPITIKRVVPADWTSAKVYVDNNPVKCSYKVLNDIKYVIFDVVPDTQKVAIVKSDEPIPSSIKKVSSNIEIKQKGKSVIIKAKDKFSYYIYDSTGRIIKRGENSNYALIEMQGHTGVYFLNATSFEGNYLNKLIVL